jgi:hypothetical protein
MGKKCIPGIICFENMTFGLLIIIGVMVFYLYYVHLTKPSQPTVYSPYPLQNAHSPSSIIVSGETSDPRVQMSNPYTPPLKTDNIVVRQPASASSPFGIPINIPTSTADTPYSQTGILTKQSSGGEQMILPLMGRNLRNGRDKWQYYTMTNSAGSINTKLPISVNGKSCTGEYGCDSISTGDIAYVEGYNDTFRVTIYENSLLRYLPL